MSIFDGGTDFELDHSKRRRKRRSEESRINTTSTDFFPPKGWSVVGKASPTKINTGPCSEFRSGPVMPQCVQVAAHEVVVPPENKVDDFDKPLVWPDRVLMALGLKQPTEEAAIDGEGLFEFDREELRQRL